VSSDRNFSRAHFAHVLLVGVSVVAVVGIGAGLILAIIGAMTPLIFGVVAAPISIWAWWFFRPSPDVAAMPSVRWWVVVVLIGGIGIVTLLNVTSSAEDLQTYRDPGVYLTTGKWIANRGNLLIDGATDGFAGFEHVTGRTGGYYEMRDDGLLYAQFNHGLPVVLAVSDWLGGDRLMFNIVPLIGAAFLLLLFVLLRRFFADWISLIAVGTAAFNLIFWHFARGTYSEPLLALLLVLALLAIDHAIRVGSTRQWVAAGILIGSTAFVRIDAWFYIAVFGGIIAILSWLRDTNASPRFRSANAISALVAVWLVGSVGFADLVLRSPGYFGDLWPRVRFMLGAAVLSGIIAVLAILVKSFRPRMVEAMRALWVSAEGVIRIAGALAIGVFFLWALLWRPEHNIGRGASQAGAIGALMAREGVPPDETRSFFELSARWLSWYWGVAGIAAAALGWSLAVGRRSIQYRRRLFIPLTLTGLTLLPYIVNPSITPDQLWAMRRFYPMGLIGMSVAVGLLMSLTVDWIRNTTFRRMGEPLFAVAAAGALVVIPLVYAMPLATASTQVGMYGSTMQLCADLPDDAVVLVEAGRISTVFSAAIRSFCDLPVASLVANAPSATTDAVGESWRSHGRSLYLVGPPDACILDSDPIDSSTFVFSLPEATLTHRPNQTSDVAFGWELGRWGAESLASGARTSWIAEIQTEWAPADSSSIVAIEGDRETARWWLEYRPTGLLEFWVNTASGPMGVGLPTPLDDGGARSIPFGIDGDIIFIGCGANFRSLSAPGIVGPAGDIEIGKRYAGNFGKWAFVGEVGVERDR
jgi:hypothetical protein